MASYKDARVLNPWRLRLLGLLDSLGTVRAVAETLHMSPSTVSQQLAVLETETRSKLIERSGRRVRLTRSGVALAAAAGRSWTGWPRRRPSCAR
jgi:DNA-binding transcriptional LysR family regulator